ncbi:MAG: hypothetical protein OHK0048_08200 [Rhodoferax sp.]
MNKRRFLMACTASVATAPGLVQAQQAPQGLKGPALLTVSGLIGKGNRGALDPALDQLMVKQKVQFDKAHAFDFAALSALPATTIKPTLEYDQRQHTLSGPLIAQVMQAAGAPQDARLLMRAIDGYTVTLTLAQARAHRYIIATQLDGHAMPLGGLGPLWAVYEPDAYPELKAKPLNERFALCPWGLYHIEVQKA